MFRAKRSDMIEKEDLFDRIGQFLADHRLSPDPAHYSFVHALMTDPDGPTARAVASLTDGGVRLAHDDVIRLGGAVVNGPPVQSAPAPVRTFEPSPEARSDALVAATQSQVEGFAETVRVMHAVTQGFGRDLEESAAAITRQPTVAGLDQIASLTGGMIARIRDTEVRLAQATAEADALRAKLAEARETARRDPLTGLANRLAFEEAFAACRKVEEPCCIAVCDVDRFKLINDRHGHHVGDRVLSVIGQMLAKACEGHLVSRHGGEEFAILLGGVSLTDAAALLDSARADVAARRFRVRDTEEGIGQVTFSAGVTAIRADDSHEGAFVRADQLLYTAKSQGRDQVCAA